MSTMKSQADLALRIRSFRPPPSPELKRVCFVVCNSELLSDQQRHEAWRATSERKRDSERKLQFQVAFAVSEVDTSCLKFLRDIHCSDRSVTMEVAVLPFVCALLFPLSVLQPLNQPNFF